MMCLRIVYGGGVPAKCLGQRFERNKIDTLENAEWWNHDMEWIRQFADEWYEKEKEL